MNGIYLLLGSNLGDRLLNLKTATNLLEAVGIRILNESSIYETEPWGKADQGWFLNLVLQTETALEPTQLLELCLETEKRMGRKRKEKWGERLIDIDILYYENQIIEGKKLSIPHPAIADRRFTLIPMCELQPNGKHPILDKSQVELLSTCDDNLECKLTEHSVSY